MVVHPVGADDLQRPAGTGLVTPPLGDGLLGAVDPLRGRGSPFRPPEPHPVEAKKPVHAGSPVEELTKPRGLHPAAVLHPQVAADIVGEAIVRVLLDRDVPGAAGGPARRRLVENTRRRKRMSVEGVSSPSDSIPTGGSKHGRPVSSSQLAPTKREPDTPGRRQTISGASGQS